LLAVEAATSAGAALGRSAGSLRVFIELIEVLAKTAPAQPLSRMMELTIERSGLREHYRKEKGEQAESAAGNLDELINACRGFERPAKTQPRSGEFLSCARRVEPASARPHRRGLRAADDACTRRKVSNFRSSISSAWRTACSESAFGQ